MRAKPLKVARVGNSRGVRIPAPTLKRYNIGDSVIMEERPEGILLRPKHSPPPKLSWKDTAAAMAAAAEDWSDWDDTRSDGLDQLPWYDTSPAKRAARKVAEPKPTIPAPSKARKPKKSP